MLPSSPPKIPQNFTLRRIFLGVLLLSLFIGIAWYTWHNYANGTEDLLRSIYEKVDDLADTHPIFLISTCTLLIMFGLPVTFFYVLTTAVYGVENSLLINTLVLALQLSVTYGIAKYLLKKPLTRFLEKKGYPLKTIPPHKQTQVVLLFRAFPMVAIALQNIILALGGVPFRKYFWLSWPLQCIWMVAIVLSSGSIFEGNFGFAVGGFVLVISLLLITKVLKKKFTKGPSNATDK